MIITSGFIILVAVVVACVACSGTGRFAAGHPASAERVHRQGDHHGFVSIRIVSDDFGNSMHVSVSRPWHPGAQSSGLAGGCGLEARSAGVQCPAGDSFGSAAGGFAGYGARCGLRG